MPRQRIRYSADEIIPDLYTYGNEFMYENNIEYIGPYHRYITGEVYTEFKWNPKTSKLLIPYTDTTSTIYTYKKLKPTIETKFKSFNEYIITPTWQDYSDGYVTRYFIKKRNESIIIEIDLNTYKLYNAHEIDPNLYETYSFNWYISGTVETTKSNNILVLGVRDKNISQLNIAEKAFPGISAKLDNLLELYVDTNFNVPKDINMI